MTREEEAAKVLDCAWHGLECKTTMSINEAYGLAIKRLRGQGCWYCNDDVMQVVDSPNKPPINATYCGLCGRKLEVEG